MGHRLAAALAVAATLPAVPALVAPASAQAPGTYGPYAVPAPDTKPPWLTKVALKPKAGRAKIKRTLTFTLDEPARMSGVVMRRAAGVRTRGRRCVRRTRSRKGPGCTLRIRAGTLLAARAGRGGNRARLSVRELAPGDYTLTLTPTDAAGNVGATKSVAFRIEPEPVRKTRRPRAR